MCLLFMYVLKGVSFVWVPGSSALVVCHPLLMITTELVSINKSRLIYYDAIYVKLCYKEVDFVSGVQ